MEKGINCYIKTIFRFRTTINLDPRKEKEEIEEPAEEEPTENPKEDEKPNVDQ